MFSWKIAAIRAVWIPNPIACKLQVQGVWDAAPDSCMYLMNLSAAGG